MAESEEELKCLWVKVKKESEKAGLKLSIQKMKIVASGPVTSWQIDGEKVETVTDFIFLGSKITSDGDCNHEIKTLSPWKKSYDKPRHLIRKQRHHFSNKGPYSQIYGFSSSHIPMWELDHKEGWAPKNWCFQTVVLRKTPESPLDCKGIKPVNIKGNQPWILIGRTDADSGFIILVTWCEQPTHWKSPWCWERLRAEGEQGVRGWDGWMASPMQWTWTWANCGRWWVTGRPAVLQSMGSQRVGHDLATEQQQQCALARDSYFCSILSYWSKWDSKVAPNPPLILSFSCITTEVWFRLIIIHSYSHLKVIKQFSVKLQ